MLTARGKYGLKAVAHLAGLPPETSAMSSEMAEANNISKKFLDAILADLKGAGIVTSKKGPGGGYRLARKPQKISVADVIRVLDGPLAPIACASRTAYRPCKDCLDVKRCQVRITMTRVRDAMSSVLDGMTIDGMVRRRVSAGKSKSGR
jgi:Rrf2 family protein